jgi:tetratricopeptide (TPR) repeat protein
MKRLKTVTCLRLAARAAMVILVLLSITVPAAADLDPAVPEPLLSDWALNNLAEVYWAQGRYAEAEPPAERALAIAETALGPTDPDVGWALKNLAEVYSAQGRFAEAERLQRRAISLVEKILGGGHPELLTMQQRLTELIKQNPPHKMQGDVCRAVRVIQRTRRSRSQPRKPLLDRGYGQPNAR